MTITIPCASCSRPIAMPANECDDCAAGNFVRAERLPNGLINVCRAFSLSEGNAVRLRDALTEAIDDPSTPSGGGV